MTFTVSGMFGLTAKLHLKTSHKSSKNTLSKFQVNMKSEIYRQSGSSSAVKV